jgi:NAD+ kinase
MENRFKNFAIVHNPTKPDTLKVAEKLRGILEKLGAKAKVYKTAPNNFKGHDAAAAIGGDGTLLGCVAAALTSQIPLVGVNMGKLGYLASVDKNHLEASFKKVLKGEYIPTPRMVLKTTFPDGQIYYSLNDLVIKSAEYRLAELKVSADGERVTEYEGDGLIFSTPTGSTAYNLSAGGPILQIKTESIVVTPICAHTLTNRSVVFNSRSRLRVELGHTLCAVHINVDGRAVAESRSCLPLTVRQATRKLVTLEDPRRGSFETLRAKLGWR